MTMPREEEKERLFLLGPLLTSRGWELVSGILTLTKVRHPKFCSVEVAGVVELAMHLRQHPTPPCHTSGEASGWPLAWPV